METAGTGRAAPKAPPQPSSWMYHQRQVRTTHLGVPAQPLRRCASNRSDSQQTCPAKQAIPRPGFISREMPRANQHAVGLAETRTQSQARLGHFLQVGRDKPPFQPVLTSQKRSLGCCICGFPNKDGSCRGSSGWPLSHRIFAPDKRLEEGDTTDPSDWG